MNLKTAVETLLNTYQSLDTVAQGLPVDAKEVAEALAVAEPGSGEHLALSILAKWNPYTAPKKKAAE